MQKHRQVIETNKSHLHVNANIHKQCTVIEKKHKDKLLRQMHTYIVCSQKPITNAHIHKQCTVRISMDKSLYAHKSW